LGSSLTWLRPETVKSPTSASRRLGSLFRVSPGPTAISAAADQLPLLRSLPLQRYQRREPTCPGLPHPVRCASGASHPLDAFLLPASPRPSRGKYAHGVLPSGAFPSRKAVPPLRSTLPSCRRLRRLTAPQPGSRALLLSRVRCTTAGSYTYCHARCSPGLPSPLRPPPTTRWIALQRPSSPVVRLPYGNPHSGVSLNAVSHFSAVRKQRRVPFWGPCTSFLTTPPQTTSARAYVFSLGRGWHRCSLSPSVSRRQPWLHPFGRNLRGSTSAWPRWRRQARVSSTRVRG
jgi:hypothetical protein